MCRVKERHEEAAQENRDRKRRLHWTGPTGPRGMTRHFVTTLLDNRVLVGETQSNSDAQPIQESFLVDSYAMAATGRVAAIDDDRLRYMQEED